MWKARLRIQRGLTQAQLAELVGTRQPSIARLENGNSFPSLSFLKRIADALDAYSPEDVQTLAEELFKHVYVQYPDAVENVYS